MMKKILLAAVTAALILGMLGGCGKPQAEPPADTEISASPAAPTAAPSEETAPPAEMEGDTEGTALPDSVDAAYAQQIERYAAAISDKWDEGTYFAHEMSALAAYYYEGNAPDNIGFTCMDLDGDNVRELIVGAIGNAEQDPLVFEIWTLHNGVPVMLAQSGSRNRYYLQYAEEDGVWGVAYEAENGAANHAVYYLRLADGAFEVIQGVVFDAVASENAPWFLAYDLDWDVSNDTPIDEATADAVMEAGRNIYTAVEYIPYSRYK